MALLWAESFGKYGLYEKKAQDDLWYYLDGVGSGWSLQTSIVRTGTHAILGDWPAFITRELGVTATTIGVGFNLWLYHLPALPDESQILLLRDSNSLTNITLDIQTTGTIEVYRGDSYSSGGGVKIAESSTPCIGTNRFQRVEIKAVIHGSTGSVEVRVNGVTVASASNIDTHASDAESTGSGTPNANVSEISFLGRGTTANNLVAYVDDIVVWDGTGSYNNDFIGDQRVYALAPNGDTAQADWTALSGSGFSNIDEADPDEDTSYLYAAAPGSPNTLTSEFDLENLPVSSGSVAAVIACSRVRKDVAGLVEFQHGLVSGASESKGAARPCDPVYIFKEDVFETDPASGVAFTPSDVNSLKIQINRTT